MVPLGIETNQMRGITFDPRGAAWIALVEDDRRQVVKADLLTGEAEADGRPRSERGPAYLVEMQFSRLE